MKFWNKRSTMPTMGSYLLENMILDYYNQETNVASTYVDVEIPKSLSYINQHIHSVVNDPKGIQGDINILTDDERNKIQTRTYEDYNKAKDARNLENDNKNKDSINKWREIFGDKFPEYS